MRTKYSLPLACDNAILKTLGDQIETNQKNLQPTQPPYSKLSQVGIELTEHSTVRHPVQLLQPHFDPQHMAALQPAIQLYMHLISQALPIFHALIHRLPSLEPRTTLSERRVYTFAEPHSELTDEQTELTERFLGLIGREVKWSIADGSTDGCPDAGWTTIRPDRPLLADGLLGHGSTITTSLTSVLELQAAIEAGDQDQAKYLSLQLASMWMHELTHAVVFAVLPDRGDEEVFLGPKAQTSEAGFEMEAYLFGGQFCLLTNEPSITILRDSLVVKQWPVWATVKSYGGVERDDFLLTRADQQEMDRKWDVVWKVDWPWIRRLFTEYFWSRGTAMSRAVELRPFKRMGLLRDLGATPMTQSERDLVGLALRREGFALGDDGLIVEWRGQSGARL